MSDKGKRLSIALQYRFWLCNSSSTVRGRGTATPIVSARTQTCTRRGALSHWSMISTKSSSAQCVACSHWRAREQKFRVAKRNGDLFVDHTQDHITLRVFLLQVVDDSLQLGSQCVRHDSLGAGLFLSHAFLVNVEVALLRKQPRNRTLGNTSLPRWFLVAKNVWFCFCSNQFLWLLSNSSCVGTLFGELVRVVFL